MLLLKTQATEHMIVHRCGCYKCATKTSKKSCHGRTKRSLSGSMFPNLFSFWVYESLLKEYCSCCSSRFTSQLQSQHPSFLHSWSDLSKYWASLSGSHLRGKWSFSSNSDRILINKLKKFWQCDNNMMQTQLFWNFKFGGIVFWGWIQEGGTFFKVLLAKPREISQLVLTSKFECSPMKLS